MNQESRGVLIGLIAISASTLIVEIGLTKFLSFKVYHNFSYAIIATTIFGLGLAGATLHACPRLVDEGPARSWRFAANCAAGYAITLMAGILLFCWMPLDPYNLDWPFWAQLASVPLYMAIFTVPFFLAGLCVSITLTASIRPINALYFWDIAAAATGASLSVPLLSQAGGFGTMLIAAGLGVVAHVAFARASGTGISVRALSVCALVAVFFMSYSGWATKQYGFDIRSCKDSDLRSCFLKDFGGISSTYWNAIARIDVSHTATSRSDRFGWTFSNRVHADRIPGRFILVDGGASTRQFAVTGPLEAQAALSESLIACPYVIRPDAKKTLIIGPGGGVDILMAKRAGIAAIDAVELNPTTFALLAGTAADPERDRYLPWLSSTATSRVQLFNTEGRHFVTTCPENEYDVIHATGVDTLTAVATGGMSLVENYLYTSDAVVDYGRVLRKNGILSLTHWRTNPPSMSLRMFLTYLEYLVAKGVKEPWRHLIVLAESGWTDTIMCAEPFTLEQSGRVRDWVVREGFAALCLPGRTGAERLGRYSPPERIYADLAMANAAGRAEILSRWPANPAPVPDDRPYFYEGVLPEHQVVRSVGDIHMPLVITAFLAALLMVGLPLRRIPKSTVDGTLLRRLCFFGTCGLAFILYETSLIQLLGVFVGGPLYALSMVLVSVLVGYSLGSAFAWRLTPGARVFRTIGIALGATLVVLATGVPPLLHHLLFLSFHARLIVGFLVSASPSFLAGIPVSLAMGQVKATDRLLVPWMWSVNSAFNVLGALLFVPLTLTTGFVGAMLCSAGLYLVAGFVIP